MNSQITFCAVLRNEAQRCRYVLDLATELFSHIVIAVQDGDDETLQICQEYPAELIRRPAESPEESKDYIMAEVKTQWTFWLDADEFPSLDLIKYLDTFYSDTLVGYDAMSFLRINYIDGLIIEGGQGEDRQFRLIRSDVRWNPKVQGRRIHIHPQIKYPLLSQKKIYHHRSFDKVKKQTQRWNELEESTRGACDQYVAKVEEELKWKKNT
jgi:hypothetical protein